MYKMKQRKEGEEIQGGESENDHNSKREWRQQCQSQKGLWRKKDFSEKINRIGAMNFQKTGILVLELNGNKHHFILSHHLIRR